MPLQTKNMIGIDFTNLPLIDINETDALIWDWNGTLLDDVEVNVKVVNEMLQRRGLQQLALDTYKELFCFPVKSFHERIGFDFEKESIEEISVEYRATYQMYENGIRLNPDTSFVLNSLMEKGINQYILSAAMKTDLLKMLTDFNIADKFKAVYGADNICAAGKVEIGKLMMRENSLNPRRTLIIGDTLHDAEVARSLGIKYILYSGGHNSHNLLAKGAMIIGSLRELLF